MHWRLAMALFTMASGCGDAANTPSASTSDSTVPDADQDGFDALVDCDDANPAVFPGAPEHCDGIDEDCDGDTDEDAIDLVTTYQDDDGDGFGADGTGQDACPRKGLVTLAGDCDDTDLNRFPGAPERCDGLDNDCDANTTEDGVVSVGEGAFATIQAAVDAAEDGDTVWVCSGTYVENIRLPGLETLTLASRNGAASTTIDGAGQGRVLTNNVGHLTLDGLTLTGGSERTFGEGGGAVQVEGGELTVTDCAFEGNSHADSGGAIALRDARATLVGTDFTGNSATNGGAISAVGSVVVVDGALFMRNQATAYGGGLQALFQSYVTIDRGIFSTNTAGFSGGAFYTLQSDLVSSQSNFSANEAAMWGGAGDVGGPLEVIDTAFEGNTAGLYGGALQVNAVTTITRTSLDINRAQKGGALHLMADATLDGVTLTANVATDVGGGMLIANGAQVQLTDCVVQQNSASRGGGAASERFGWGQLVSANTDWGLGNTDNDPDDVFLDVGSLSYAAAGDFVCDVTLGRCE